MHDEGACVRALPGAVGAGAGTVTLHMHHPFEPHPSSQSPSFLILLFTGTTGVAHVIWMGFFYLPGLNAAVDYGTAEIKKICKVGDTVAVSLDPSFVHAWAIHLSLSFSFFPSFVFAWARASASTHTHTPDPPSPPHTHRTPPWTATSRTAATSTCPGDGTACTPPTVRSPVLKHAHTLTHTYTSHSPAVVCPRAAPPSRSAATRLAPSPPQKRPSPNQTLNHRIPHIVPNE